MELQQVIISSSGQNPLDPNVLVARSEKVTDEMVAKLMPWTPGRNGLAYGQRQGLAFFRPTTDTYAVMRCSVGPMDYQLQRQIVSRILLLSSTHLAYVYNHGGLLLHYLRSAGHMVLPPDPPPCLPAIPFPKRALLKLMSQPRLSGEVDVLLKTYRLHRQIAVTGIARPLALMGALANELSLQERSDATFSVGLRATSDRPFRVHLFHDNDYDMTRELAQQQIRPIEMNELTRKSKLAAV